MDKSFSTLIPSLMSKERTEGKSAVSPQRPHGYRELPRFTLSRHHLLQRAIARELGSTLRWSRHNVAHCYIGCADWIQCNLDFSLLFWAKRNQLGYVNHSFGETWDLPNFQNDFLTENPWHMEESISKLAPGVRALTGSLNLHQRGKR